MIIGCLTFFSDARKSKFSLYTWSACTYGLFLASRVDGRSYATIVLPLAFDNRKRSCFSDELQ